MTANSIQLALSLGSNINRYRRIGAGIDALRRHFGPLICSPVYESAAVGFDGSAFLNLIVLVQSSASLADVNLILKQIEDDNGRDRSGPKFGSRTLDIDVVTYGDFAGLMEGIELPRPELFKNAFVLLPLVDLVPQQQVPGLEQTYSELWLSQGARGQQLTQVPFDFER
ncbi:MAG: 2-amino-4-hydroxy-6-hydroxymethyldihydropteridine diphosphokinase [Reinekea sp.]|jgi:2-amino-4-hydroxy-6-hydroxymethyldihydropteridine diphosphokinase